MTHPLSDYNHLCVPWWCGRIHWDSHLKDHKQKEFLSRKKKTCAWRSLSFGSGGCVSADGMWILMCLKTAVALRREVMGRVSCSEDTQEGEPTKEKSQTFAPVPETHARTHALILKRRGCGLFLRHAEQPGPGWWSAVAAPGTDCKAQCRCGRRLPPTAAPRLWDSARRGRGRERSRSPRPPYRGWLAPATGSWTLSRCWKRRRRCVSAGDAWQRRHTQGARDLLGEGVEAVRLLGVREGHSHAGG